MMAENPLGQLELYRVTVLVNLRRHDAVWQHIARHPS
jgi:hypothetical protein